MASYMKKTFEKKYKSVWHCIVGKSRFPLDSLSIIAMINLNEYREELWSIRDS